MRAVAMADLNSLLIDSIDETISSVLGGVILEATYRFLAKDCGITRERIPEQLDKFDGALVRMYGVGGITLSRAIAKRLCGKLGYEFVPMRDKRLVDYVNEAKKRLG